MIGKDSMGAGGPPRHSEPIGHEPLNRTDARFADADTQSPVAPLSAQVPEGRRISLTSWAVAAVVGVALWVLIIGLI